MKAAGTSSKAPLTEAFARWGNLRLVILALLGATAGQAVVWYCGQFYALFFLTQVLKVAAQPANMLIAAALAASARPSSWCSAGSPTASAASRSCWPAACSRRVTYYPIFQGLTHYANPALETRCSQLRR